jgi:hypothetical protein
MPANTSPVFGLTPNVGCITFGATALTKSDGSSVTGIGTDIYKAFTAGTNGSYVEKIRLSPVATVASTANTATVIRIYVSSVTSGITANTNTFPIAEVQAPAQTLDQTTTATFYFEVPLNIKLNASWTILVSTHLVNAANTNWQAVVLGMDF